MNFSQAWNEEYERFPVTNWERNDLFDLAHFIGRCGFTRGQVQSMLDAGCGRGIRGLVALLMNPALNVPETRYLGVDFSASAIASAADTSARWNDAVQPVTELEKTACDMLLGTGQLNLCARTHYICQDLISFLSTGEETFDLVIDWMCLHELMISERREYCGLLGNVARNGLILNEFSRELSSVESLGFAVEGVYKYLMSKNEISDLFPQFQILATQDYVEDLNPNPTITDGIIGAKRAYYLVRIR